MNRHDEITAVILSAGYSSRMGQFKPLLPLGPVTVLERAVRVFLDTGVTDVRVVVGHRAEDLTSLLRELDVRWVMNDRFAEGMLPSVQEGVRTLESTKKALFVLPVDLPLVRRITVVDLLNAHDTQNADVLYPCFLGRRGHPPLISAKLGPRILSWNQVGGLRAILRNCRSMDVEVADEHILPDMDSLADYEDICTRLPDYHIPSPEECMAILTRKVSVSEEVFAHSRKVAQVALSLADALDKAGCHLNAKLVVAASLLHDLAKGHRDHASVAARLVAEMGYPAVASVVGAHMNTEDAGKDSSICERDVVGLADKLVQGDRIVRLEERYRKKCDECSCDGGGREVIAGRLDQTLKLKQKFERRLGMALESVLAATTGEKHAGEGAGLPIETR